MRTLVFGASAGIGRALARALAAKGHDLVLVARDLRDLEAEAAHLRLTLGVGVECLVLDATMPERVAEAMARLAPEPPILNLLFAVGMTSPRDTVASAPAEAAALIDANLVSVMAAVATLLPRLREADRGNIVGIGSVAAIRGRNANVAYAAAKRGLESYFESLRHALSATGIRVQLYRLGYVDTQMSFGKKLMLPMASAEQVADRIVRGLGRDVGLAHVPAFWAGVALAVRNMPWAIFRRLEF